MDIRDQRHPGHQEKTQGETEWRPNQGSGTKTQKTWVKTKPRLEEKGEEPRWRRGGEGEEEAQCQTEHGKEKKRRRKYQESGRGERKRRQGGS